MTLTITLDVETEQAIAAKAARPKMSPSDYVRRLTERAARPKLRREKFVTPQQELSVAEALKKFIGFVHGTTGPIPGITWSDVEAPCDDN